MAVSVNCSKCGHAVTGRATRRGNHPICPRRRLKRGERKRRGLALIAKKGWDMEATAARKFKHPKSRVMQGGREILHGLDYQLRVREVLERDGYRCHWETEFEDGKGYTCFGPANNHPHHLLKRSDGRDDRAGNLIAICDIHHAAAHPEKQLRNPRLPSSADLDAHEAEETIRRQTA